MALHTSTPKSKRLIEEEVSLLSLNSENEDVSSGYDSPVYNSGNTKESCHRKLQMAASSYDSDFSSEDSTQFSDSSSDDDDSDDLYEIESTESMKVTSTQTLIDNLRYILSMPDLCDLVFIVGPHRIPVYGIKAILSTRSRAFFIMFLKHSKEISLDKKDKKKMKKHNNTYSEHGNRMTIIVDNYDADVFRSFLLFVHCGSVVIDVATVTGFLCLATEFDIPDLRSACWEFIERSIMVPVNSSMLMKDTFRYGDHKAAQRLRLKILRIPANNRSSALNMTSFDRTLNDSEQDVHTSTLNDSGDVHTSTLNNSEQDVHTSTLNDSGDVHTSTCSTETMV